MYFTCLTSGSLGMVEIPRVSQLVMCMQKWLCFDPCRKHVSVLSDSSVSQEQSASADPHVTVTLFIQRATQNRTIYEILSYVA